MRRILLTAAALLLALPAGAQSLRVGLNSDPDALDPTVSRTVSGRQVFAAMCDKLVDIDPALNLVPQLATAWHWEDADKTLVLTLRPGVQFHDGTVMDGEAVAASLRRHLSLPGSTRKAEMGPVESVEASGPLETRIHLSKPFAPLVAALADRAGMILSKPAAALSGNDFAKAPVCAGPFRFVRRIAQDRIELERFPGYWNAGAIHFDRVTYFPIPDATIRGVNLRSGQLDLIETVQPSDIPILRAVRGLRVVTGPSLASFYIAVNVANGPRANSKIGQSAAVREALSKAIDRKALVDVVFAGLYVPGHQSVPRGDPVHGGRGRDRRAAQQGRNGDPAAAMDERRFRDPADPMERPGGCGRQPLQLQRMRHGAERRPLLQPEVGRRAGRRARHHRHGTPHGRLHRGRRDLPGRPTLFVSVSFGVDHGDDRSAGRLAGGAGQPVPPARRAAEALSRSSPAGSDHPRRRTARYQSNASSGTRIGGLVRRSAA